MSMPDMNAQGPFHMNPSQVIWTLVRDLARQQRAIVEVERRLATIQAKHVNHLDDIASLTSEPKSASDLLALQQLWYSKLLPTLIAKITFTLDFYETFGDRETTIDDPFDVGLWRSKYLAAVEDLTGKDPAG